VTLAPPSHPSSPFVDADGGSRAHGRERCANARARVHLSRGDGAAATARDGAARRGA